MKSPAAAIPWAIYALVGGLFAAKYAPRIGWSLAPAFAAWLAFFAAALGCGRFAFNRWGRRSWSVPVLIGLYLALALPVYFRIDPQALRVDRWSALHNFLAAAFAGRFPYQALTHLGHDISGFPELFVAASPFYALGDVGYAQFAALLGFAWLARRRQGLAAAATLGTLLLLPPFQYEVFCRSDLFANMALICALLHFLGAPAGRKVPPGRGAWEGMLWGLALATRGVVVVPFLLFGAAVLRVRGVKAAALLAVTAALTAGAAFLPFYLWDPDLFRAHNPFHVQSGAIPAWALALVMAACAASGWRSAAAEGGPVRDDAWLFRQTGVALFCTVLGCFLLALVREGWAAWEDGGFDITYFTLCLPFLLLGYPAGTGRANLVHSPRYPEMIPP